jgi:ectoine hydroxylase-related dioxygenase (phytanoyl-CoA dioxygenase family)
MAQDFVLDLTDDQVGFYRENGYLTVDRITTDEEVEKLKVLYEDAINSSAGRIKFEGKREDGSTGHITQVIAPELSHPELLESIYFRNARNAALKLAGITSDQIQRQGTMFIYKPEKAGRDTPWHQDEAYWKDFETLKANSLSCWMPLDNVTVESGCMWYLPKSQALDILNYKRVGGPQPIVLDSDVDLSTAVSCPMPAGAAVFHHCRILHFAGTNTTENKRRAMSAVFHGPTVDREVPIPRPWLDEPLGVHG